MTAHSHDTAGVADRPIRAVLFDYAGTMTEEMLPAVAAHAAAAGATTEGLAEVLLGTYGDASEHPLHRVERGEMSLVDLASWGRTQGAARGWDIDLGALYSSIMDLPIRPQMIECLRRLRVGGVRTALVTNAAREGAVQWRASGLIDELFDEVIDSSAVGVRKPDRAIFALTLDRLGVTADEAVLLDDMQINVDAAIAMGMHGIRVGPDATQALLELDLLLDGQSQQVELSLNHTSTSRQLH